MIGGGASMAGGEAAGNRERRWLDLQRQRHHSRRDFAEYQFHSARSRVRDELVPLTGKDRPRLLDVGCGLGGLAVAYAAGGAVVTAVDTQLYDADSLEFARSFAAAKGAEVEFLGVAETDWPMPDASFDVVLLDSVIEHAPDPRRLLRESARVLGPGGWMLISFPVFYGPFGGHIDDYIRIPWWHLLPKPLVRASLRRRRPRGGYVTPEFSIGMFDSLNRMTLRRFHELLAPLPLELVTLRRAAFLTTPGNQLVYDLRTALARSDRRAAWAALRRAPRDFSFVDACLFLLLLPTLPLMRVPLLRELFLGGVRAKLRKVEIADPGAGLRAQTAPQRK
jgi:SAM-dependent methyltransferase